MDNDNFVFWFLTIATAVILAGLAWEAYSHATQGAC